MKNKILGFGASSMEGVGDETGGGFFKRIQPAFSPCQFVNLAADGVHFNAQGHQVMAELVKAALLS